MAAEFLLEIITPDREFFSGTVEELIINTPTGEIEIMYHTLPMVTLISSGLFTIKQNGKKMEAVCSDGFMRVGNTVTVLVQLCKWPYEIDEEETTKEIKQLNYKIKRAQSMKEYRAVKAQLAMQLANLKAKGMEIK